MKTAVCSLYFADGPDRRLVESLRGRPTRFTWGRSTRSCRRSHVDARGRPAGQVRGAQLLLEHAGTLSCCCSWTMTCVAVGFLGTTSHFERLGVRWRSRRSGRVVPEPSDHLEQRGCWARRTDFVESGPVMSMRRDF